MTGKRLLSLLLCLLMSAALAACAGSGPSPSPAPTASEPPAATEMTEMPEPTASTSPAVADASQMTTVENVVEEGMTPVYADRLVDGDYPVEVKSSSSMFRIESAVLHVAAGKLEATLNMGGKSYLFVFPGSAMEAATGEESAYIPFIENEEGAHCFTIPVEALDAPVPCAAFSRNKQLWYDRTLLFRADSLPREAYQEGFFITAESLGLEDGEYTVSVTLSGGSGRASVQSPCRLWVENGRCTAEIIWGSANYDYMKVDGSQINAVIRDGHSVCVIPVTAFDRALTVIADTTAMSQPHEITYTLSFDSGSIARPG